MLISNFILFNCIVIIFSIFSFFFTVLYLTILLFTTNFKLFNCVVINFLYFLIQYSLHRFIHNNIIVHHQFQLLFYSVFIIFSIFLFDLCSFHRFIADNYVLCTTNVKLFNNYCIERITLSLFSYSILFSWPPIYCIVIIFSISLFNFLFTDLYLTIFILTLKSQV